MQNILFDKGHESGYVINPHDLKVRKQIAQLSGWTTDLNTLVKKMFKWEVSSRKDAYHFSLGKCKYNQWLKCLIKNAYHKKCWQCQYWRGCGATDLFGGDAKCTVKMVQFKKFLKIKRTFIRWPNSPILKPFIQDKWKRSRKNLQALPTNSFAHNCP